MRFLRQSRGRWLLPTGLIALSLNSLSIYAADRSHDSPIEVDDVDLAKLQSGGQVVFVSSGQRPASFHSIDDDRRTVFQFASSDPRPIVIVKITDSKPIHRVSVVPGSASSKVDVYLLDELPRNPSELDKSTPLTSIVDLVVGKEAAVDFPPQPAHYVALRWTPALTGVGPFKVAEISAFAKGDSPHVADALAATAPPVFLVPDPPVIAPTSP
jgi:hypothetical protein